MTNKTKEIELEKLSEEQVLQCISVLETLNADTNQISYRLEDFYSLKNIKLLTLMLQATVFHYQIL